MSIGCYLELSFVEFIDQLTYMILLLFVGKILNQYNSIKHQDICGNEVLDLGN